MQTCVLFVDDEPLILSLYEALSGDLGPDFTVKTARDGREALDVLERTQAQIVVSDLEMPEMAGGELLTHVERKYPEAMRVVISGYDDELHVAKCLTFGHRYLRKPIEPETLASTLQRLAALQQALSEEPLKSLVSSSDALPSPPETYLRLSESLQANSSGTDDFATIIADDPLLSDKLLGIANSPEFGLSIEIESIKELFEVVGVHVVRALILGLHTKDFFAPRTRNHALFDELWKHSLQTASFARKLASADRQNFRDCQTAYVAGLLHDIGKFIIAANAKPERGPGEANHAAVGAYLLGLWGLPEPIVATAELHHSLHLVTSHSYYPIVYVHAGQNLGFAGRVDQLDLDFLSKAGKTDRVPVWQELLLKLN
jgi:putative nucleotidyltransferase with HDIG domain